MRHDLDVIKPPGIAKLPVDKRGYPILYMSAYLPDGTPDFARVDSEIVARCAKERLCGICGELVGYRIAFVGGPLMAKNRASQDPGVHIECAHYAVQVCPYLSSETTKYATKLKGPVIEVEGQSLAKAPVAVVAITRKYQFYPGTHLFKFGAPTQIRVYPYGGQGSWSEPTPAEFDMYCEESLRRSIEDFEARKAQKHRDWLASHGAL